MKNFNERIKELRCQLHLSQEYVANHLKMNRASYTLLENGKRKATAEDVTKLSLLFGISADALLKGDVEEKPITTAFARSFESLDETDQAEIMNLIHFKEQMKAQRK